MVGDLLEMLLEASATRVEVQVNPALMRPIDIPVVVCDPRRIQAQTGWEPRIPLRQTLHDILVYWRETVRRELARPEA
jgi:GDP-4-dehydro-6-deoxy-D-mannose reductase